MTNQDCVQPSSIMQFFAYQHLPTKLQKISKLFCDLAEIIDRSDSDHDEEKQVALRKLLEAKDAAVRAQLTKESSSA